MSEEVTINRIIALELERIYNHIRTIGALGNDVGSSFLLNGCLSIREDMLDLQERIYGQRVMK